MPSLMFVSLLVLEELTRTYVDTERIALHVLNEKRKLFLTDLHGFNISSHWFIHACKLKI